MRRNRLIPSYREAREISRYQNRAVPRLTIGAWVTRLICSIRNRTGIHERRTNNNEVDSVAQETVQNGSVRGSGCGGFAGSEKSQRIERTKPGERRDHPEVVRSVGKPGPGYVQ